MEVFKSILKKIGVALLVAALLVFILIITKVILHNDISQIRQYDPIDIFISIILIYIAVTGLLIIGLSLSILFVSPWGLLGDLFVKKKEDTYAADFFDLLKGIIFDTKFVIVCLLSLIAWLLYNISFQLNTLIEVST